MKKYLLIILSVIVAISLGSCSKVRIQQAQMLTQAQIDEYNRNIKPGDDNPDDPGNPDEPGPDEPGPDDPGPDTPEPTGERITDGSAYFVGPTAKGLKDGSSWDHCMDASLLRTLISQKLSGGVQDDEAAYAQAEKLDGVKIYLCGGKFVLPDQDLKVVKMEWTGYTKAVEISFYGGYDPSSTEIDLTRRNAASYETVISGDLNGNDGADGADARILILGNQTNVLFDGVVFAHAYNAGSGAALTLSAGKGSCTVNMKDCTVRSNATDASSAGAGIYVQKGKLVANSCVFTQNGAKNGAAIFVNNANADVKMTSCRFLQNTAANCGGVFNHSNGKVVLQDCDLLDNVANGYAGGAIHVNGTGVPSLVCNNCNFAGNTSSSNGGAVSLETGIVTLNSCTVSVNKSATGNVGSASSGGAVAMLKANGEMHLNGCSLDQNESSGTGGAVYMNQGRLYVNDCSFADNKTHNRGIIRLNNGTCYMNNVSITGCEVTAEWGLTINCSNLGALCMNNVTIGGSKAGMPEKNPSINGSANILMVNTTIADTCPMAIMRVEGSRKAVLLNSIIVNTESAPAFLFNSTYNVTSLGSCVVGGVSGTGDGKVYTAGTGDASGVSYSALGMNWDTAKRVYTWNGTVDGLTRMDAALIGNKVKDAFPVSVTGEVDAQQVFKVENAGEDFYNWVTGIDAQAFSRDVLGKARTAQTTPGAWQAN